MAGGLAWACILRKDYWSKKESAECWSDLVCRVVLTEILKSAGYESLFHIPEACFDLQGNGLCLQSPSSLTMVSDKENRTRW